jgi:hypothetical protein
MSGGCQGNIENSLGAKRTSVIDPNDNVGTGQVALAIEPGNLEPRSEGQRSVCGGGHLPSIGFPRCRSIPFQTLSVIACESALL